MSWDIGDFQSRLDGALDSFDYSAAERIVDDWIVELRNDEGAFPAVAAKKVLGSLRRKRRFELMERGADALIHNGQGSVTVRRQMAQALIDQGRIYPALAILERLSQETGPGAPLDDPSEYCEAEGLRGRAYKQLYVDSAGSASDRRRTMLQRAIGHYSRVFRVDQDRLWHGINYVALLERASRDDVRIQGHSDVKQDAHSAARAILASIGAMKVPGYWDLATAFEACVALDDLDKAVEWLQLYLRAEGTDAFELGSTLRQLTQVWQLSVESKWKDVLGPLNAALTKSEGGAAELTGSEVSGLLGLEKVFGPESFESLAWFEVGLARAAAVARIETKLGKAFGTAFLVDGGELSNQWNGLRLLVTNAHVVSETDLDAMRPAAATARFTVPIAGQEDRTGVELLWSSPRGKLDCSILRLVEDVRHERGSIPLAPALPLGDGTERAYVIGHPQGRSLSFSIHDNILLAHKDPRVHYRSPTEPGSSGSPVFNSEWELIALHHAGRKDMPMLDKDDVYEANEGIWIQAIRKKIASG